MLEVSLDFETRSACDLRKAGAYRYAEDPSTSAWCAAFLAVDTDDEQFDVGLADVDLWVPGAGTREDYFLNELANRPDVMFRAWNAQFERAIWREFMHKRMGFPDIPAERWVCTAAEARAMNLPGKLENSAIVLGVSEQKDMAGGRLMMQMARPRKIHADGTLTWWDDQERRDRLYAYCKQDVRTELAVKERVQRLQPYERRVFVMDMRTNDRGIKLDRDLATAAKDIAARVTSKANDDLDTVTGGFVDKVTNVGRFKKWMSEAFGVDVETLSKKQVRELLNDEFLPLPVREALEIRVATGKSSVRKIESMLKACCFDDMLRGLLLFCGAGTGRWAGRLVQPQNFPARTAGVPEWWIDQFFDHPEYVVDMILRRDIPGLELEGHPLEVLSMVLRSMLVARPGKVLIAADYSAIEARVAAWLTRCQWRLEVFRTHGKIYEASASTMFNVPLEEIRKGMPLYGLRQKGKVAELALGFQGGENALITMGAYDMGLSDEELPEIKNRWREASPEFPASWRELNDACIQAVQRPGLITEALAGKVRFKVTGGFLWLKLPSGRRLAYCQPVLVWKPAPWDREKKIPGVEAWAVNSKTKQWQKRSIYGGLLFENIVQATARDLMADAMLRLEDGGKYLPLLSVHDEVIAEADADADDVAEFEGIMCSLPAWADGCPVKADGWSGHRYRK
jgi:DNA polymerase